MTVENQAPQPREPVPEPEHSPHAAERGVFADAEHGPDLEGGELGDARSAGSAGGDEAFPTRHLLAVGWSGEVAGDVCGVGEEEKAVGVQGLLAAFDLGEGGQGVGVVEVGDDGTIQGARAGPEPLAPFVTHVFYYSLVIPC